MPKSKSTASKPKKPRPTKRSEFKANMRSAVAVVGAVAFLQKVGFESTVRNIRKCIAQRCRKPVEEILGTVPTYLSKGLELGIFKKHAGSYKLGSFELKRRRRRGGKKQLEEGGGRPEAAVEVTPGVCAF